MKSSGYIWAAGALAAWAGGGVVLDCQDVGFSTAASPSFAKRFLDNLSGVLGIQNVAAATIFTCPDEYGGASSNFALGFLDPQVGSVDQQLEVIFCGSQFESGASPSLQRPGFTDLLPLSTNFVSQYELRAFFDLTGAPTGYWNAAVFNPGQGASVSLINEFLVWDQIGIWKALPGRAGNLGTVRLNVLGNGFFGLGSIQLERNGVAIPGTNVVVVNDEQVVADFDLTNQTLGDWDVVADFADGSQGHLTAGLRVETPLLHITDLSPRSGGNIGTVRVLIEADYLKHGVMAKLRRGADEIQGTQTQLTRDGLVTTFNLNQAAIGAWDLVLSDGYVPGFEAVKAGAFSVEVGKATQPWIKIIGTSAVRFENKTAFNIQIGNRGNVDTLVAPVIYGLPADVQWELKLPNSTPPSVQFNSVRSKISNGKQTILLPLTFLPANPQPVEYQLTLQVPDDDGDPLTTRLVQFGAVLE